MKKVSRFDALAKGLTFLTTPIKKKQVENVIEKARLSSELALTACDSKIEKAAAALINDPSEDKLVALSDAMQERDDLKNSILLADQVKNYLTEEIEVEMDKKL